MKTYGMFMLIAVCKIIQIHFNIPKYLNKKLNRLNSEKNINGSIRA